MKKRRVAFVLESALGWKTYRSRLEEVISTRPDIEALTIPLEVSRREALFLKRNNMRWYDHSFRKIDPITAFEGRLGEKVLSAVRSFKPDVVHFAAHWPASVMKKVEGIPFTITLDNTRPGLERDIPRGAWGEDDFKVEANLMRAASHIFPMSSWAKESIIEDFQIPSSRISIIPPSINTREFSDIHRTSEAEILKVIFIGNDLRRKGAFALADWIAERLSEKAELHIVSSDPELSKLTGRAIVHGKVPNKRLIHEILPSMDVLCLPTKSDMSPQVVVEAAAAGLPVIASSIGGIPDMIQEGRTGFAVNPQDQEQFILALEKLADDVQLRKSMGSAARKHACSFFDATTNFNRMIDKIMAVSTTEIRR